MNKPLMILAGLILIGLLGSTPKGWAQSSSGNSASNAASQENSHFLPFFKSKVPEKYREHVPLPIGVSFNYVYQVMPLELAEGSSAEVQGMQLPLKGTTLEPVTNSYVVRLDAWLLPFLNVYGTAGHFGGDAKDFKPEIPPQILQQLPPSMAPLLGALNTMKVSYSGSTFGIGLTGAFAYQRFFASYDINWNWAKPDAIKNRVIVTNHGPRIGILLSPGGLHSRIYGGAYRSSIAGRVNGSVTLESGIPVSFDVKVQPEQEWSPVAGTEVNITRHIVTGVEGAFGQTKQLVVLTGYRF